MSTLLCPIVYNRILLKDCALSTEVWLKDLARKRVEEELDQRGILIFVPRETGVEIVSQPGTIEELRAEYMHLFKRWGKPYRWELRKHTVDKSSFDSWDPDFNPHIDPQKEMMDKFLENIQEEADFSIQEKSIKEAAPTPIAWVKRNWKKELFNTGDLDKDVKYLSRYRALQIKVNGKIIQYKRKEDFKKALKEAKGYELFQSLSWKQVRRIIINRTFRGVYGEISYNTPEMGQLLETAEKLYLQYVIR